MTTSTQQHSLQIDVSDTNIATIWLNGGERPVVVLDRDLIQRLNTTLDALAQMDGIKGLILRSDCARVFVAGADLAEIDGLDDPGLHAYLAFGTTVFGRIADLPYPTVALINGATLGGGLEIAMHCDALIASKKTTSGKPYPIGLPEASLGLCPGWGGSQMLASRIDAETAIVATATGKPFLSTDMPSGLVAELVATPEELQSAAENWLQGAKPGNTPCPVITNDNADSCQNGLSKAKDTLEANESVKAVFLAIETGIADGWAAAVAIEQCELVQLRNTPEAREKLETFLSKG